MAVNLFSARERLEPFVRAFTVIEAREETTRTLLPEAGFVWGFRYGGSATQLEGAAAHLLPNNTITGLRATARRMRTSAGGGALLVMFREAGAAQFFAEPLHELFGTTAALEDLVPRAEIDRVSSRVATAENHAQRVAIVEEFCSRAGGPRHRIRSLWRRCVRSVQLAVRSESAKLARELHVSQDALEKRFRRAVGAPPKQLASILRLRRAIDAFRPGRSLSSLAIEAGYFDQSHFNREFPSVIGEAPQRAFRSGELC